MSSKQSVQSLLILERATGAIIRATGAITRPTSPDHPLAAEYAAAVFRHVKASEELVAALEAIDGGILGGVAPEKKPDGEPVAPTDDMRLCTIRTRRRELLVVPGELSPGVSRAQADTARRCEVYLGCLPRHADCVLGRRQPDGRRRAGLMERPGEGWVEWEMGLWR